MDILIRNKIVYAVANKIEFGVYDENIEKWKLMDEEGNLLYYIIDYEFEHIKDINVPTDYEDGKYFYENGEFVFNEDWKPYVSPEERLENVEVAVAEQEESNLVLEEELLSTQLALTEQFEANLAMEEELLGTQLALTEQYEANLALEEELLSTQLALTEMYEVLLMLTEG